MSGIVKSVGKVFKKVTSSKVGRGLLIAAALYYVGGLASGAMGATADVSGVADVPVDGAVGETGPPVEAAAEIPAVAAPEPTASAEPAQTAGLPKAEAAPQAATAPPLPTDQSTGLGRTGDASGTQGAWFKGLSPGAQAIIAGAMTGGAGMTMQALAQKNAQEDARRREDQAREDKMRRGSIAAYAPNAFVPKPGIIGSRIGG